MNDKIDKETGVNVSRLARKLSDRVGAAWRAEWIEKLGVVIADAYHGIGDISEPIWTRRAAKSILDQVDSQLLKPYRDRIAELEAENAQLRASVARLAPSNESETIDRLNSLILLAALSKETVQKTSVAVLRYLRADRE